MAKKNKKNELNLEQLEKVSGGWAQAHGLTWKYDIGDHVEIDTVWFFHQFTDGGTILHRGGVNDYDRGGLCPGYYVDGDSAGWYVEDDFDDDHRHTDVDVMFWID